MPTASLPLIVLPARRGSTRLPDKLLLRETGKPVLQHTIERALEAAARAAGDAARGRELVWVACDDPELAAVARACGVRPVMVTEYCESGTERIWRALGSLPESDVVVNLQADEPGMPADWIIECAAAFAAEPLPDIVTVAVPLAAGDPALEEPSAVKVVLNHRSEALYFSRAPIPYLRPGGRAPQPRALRHVGIYAYSRQFLVGYPGLAASPLELCECLEQLRFLQAGARIRVLVKPEPPDGLRGIDTYDDYRQFVARHQAAR
ncbi:MAG TPA: 3-deoxy-manno-octulosonate cytidylyltransferase [Gemmataceae bacterium]|nr:3-deoxy-manno-octulosonate cytidylyltransferase [Gemmataceae bacterium]